MREHANFTKKEAAQYLRVSTRTLDRWVSEGKLSPARIGGHTIVFPRTELDRFIAQSMERPHAA
jgi:excisionase family DNA binding protein